MTPFQKVIKYGAIAFGAYLSFCIIGIIIFGIITIFGITTGITAIQNNSEEVVLQSTEEQYTNMDRLNIDVSICKLEIKSGDKIKVETHQVSDQIVCRAEGNTLKIKDSKVIRLGDFYAGDYAVPQITIYLPKNIELKEAKIRLGANDTNIEYMRKQKN